MQRRRLGINPWSSGVVLSSRAQDSVPALFAEAQPVFDELIIPSARRRRNSRRAAETSGRVELHHCPLYRLYRRRATVTPADDATLKHGARLPNMGKRKWCWIWGHAGDAGDQLRTAVFEKYKQPTYSVSSPLRVRQVYRAGERAGDPGSQIQAGNGC